MGASPGRLTQRFTGRLTWSTLAQPSTLQQQLVPDPWPPQILRVVGPPPAGLDRSPHAFEWTTGTLRCRYEPLTAGHLLGPTTHWPHVFAVMKALAGRYGEDAGRLVTAFD